MDKEGVKGVFPEGPPNEAALRRLKKIKSELKAGYLGRVIDDCRKGQVGWDLTPLQERLFNELVSNITSEYGRAVVGLMMLQLCIKCIEPEQSIRLHKAGHGEFSWADGVPMRSLDAEFIAPTLRLTNLLRYNIFGVMMTRSLAENYPYTKFYKAAIRGPKDVWLDLVDMLEYGSLAPKEGLKKLVSLLINRSENFQKLAKEAIELKNKFLEEKHGSTDIVRMIKIHVDQSGYPARLFEVALHSLFQTLEEEDALGGQLRPLSQMRSANKKFGNVGDIEVLDPSKAVIEAWDAKYRKPYLYDELNEFEDKLPAHKHLQIAGFVVDSEPDLRDDVITKIRELTEIYGLQVVIISFDKWVAEQFQRSKSEPDECAKKWFNAYVESICHARPETAPIDEPSEVWVKELARLMQEHL